MKPEFTRPFNAEHAKAGAPYCCLNGDTAEIFKWDARGACNLAGIRSNGKTDWAQSWAECNLVMLPIGACEGKPLFVGDVLVCCKTGNLFTVQHWAFNFDGCTWPAPERAYPVSLMTDAELYVAACIKTNDAGGAEFRRNIANVAIRHAIDASQVVIAEVQP